MNTTLLLRLARCISALLLASGIWSAAGAADGPGAKLEKVNFWAVRDPQRCFPGWRERLPGPSDRVLSDIAGARAPSAYTHSN